MSNSLPNYNTTSNRYVRRDYFFDGATTLADDGWTVGSAISSGTAAPSNTIPGGALTISGAATTDNSGREVQRATETVALVPGLRTGFEVNFRVNLDVTNADLKCGIAVTDSSILASDPTDGIWFYLADGSAICYGSIKRDSAEKGLVQLGTLSNATWHTIRCEIDMDPSVAGKGSVRWHLDGTNVASLSDVTEMPHKGEETMAEFFAFQSGNATGTHSADFRMSVIKPLDLS